MEETNQFQDNREILINSENITELPCSPKMSTYLFVLLMIITGGLYVFFWILTAPKKINRLTDKEDEKINMVLPITYIVLSIFLYIFSLYSQDQATSLFLYLSTVVVKLVMCYKMLVMIENYALRTTHIKIKHNILWLLLFNVIYVNFAINNYVERVKKA